MNDICVTNDVTVVQKLLNLPRKRVSFLNLDVSEKGYTLSSYLRTLKYVEEISCQELLRSNRNIFRSQYVEAIGMVNEKNHSTNWWSIPFTDKNPFDPELCRSTACFLAIVNYLRSYSGMLIIITSNMDLARQLRLWSKSSDMEFIVSVKNDWSFKSFVKEYTPAGILKNLCRTLWDWVQTRGLNPSRDLGEEHVVITSLGHVRSFDQPNRYRDVYFGRLVTDLQDHGEKVIILALLMEKRGYQLRQIRELETISVLPVEACLTFIDIIRCALRAFYIFFGGVRLKGIAEIDGIDFSFLVKQAIRDASNTGNCFMAIRMYYAARSLASRINIKRCIYIYENLPWEKMLVSGIRESSEGTRILGYQHASVSHGHLNMLLSKNELNLVPLPDVVLTTGEIVDDWLADEGNYPDDMLQIGCSLRQTLDLNKGMAPRPDSIHHILIVLATSDTEYINVLTFLDRVLGDISGYQFRVRPHPGKSLDPVLKHLHLVHDTLFDVSEVSLDDDLDWSDLVLYASSTVAMEAVGRGIPVVYMDLGDYLDTDPMFGWNDFKWSVQDPTDLKIAIQSISDISDVKYFDLQRSGLRYVMKYLSPVTRNPANVFLES